MKTWRALKESSKAILGGYGMWMAVAASAFLFLTATVAVDGGGRSYSALQALFLVRGEWGQENMSLSLLNLSGIRTLEQSAYLLTFLPAVAAFPGVPFLLDERKSGMGRYAVSRSGRLPHYIGQVLAVWLCGGLAVLLGYLIAAVPVLIVFFHTGEMAELQDPELFELVVMSQNTFSGLYPALGDVAFLLSYAVDMFLYGAFFSLPAVVMAGILRNKYLVLCFPVILLFFYNTVWKKIFQYYFTLQDDRMIEIVGNWESSLLGSAATVPTLGKWMWIVLGLGITAVLYSFLMERRLDCGA